MADIQIESSTQNYMYYHACRGGPFWVSTTTAYVIYSDGTLVYRKTVDGGANWSNATTIVSNGVLAFDAYADWQTSGDSGTKIHMAYMDETNDAVRYVYLDTNGDSVGGDDLIETCQDSGTFAANSYRYDRVVSITKTRGGNIAVAFVYKEASAYYDGFYTSPDADTWTEKTSPFSAGVYDYIQLHPANLADSNDLWATFWDLSANDILLKTFDNSENSWSSTAIDENMADHATYLQMDGATRHSDGHLIFLAWDLYDNVNAKLKAWDITDAGTITAKTAAFDGGGATSETFLVSVFINQSNNYIYVSYVTGTTAGSVVATVYNYSDDGMATWEGQAAMQADAEDDERWVSCGAVAAANGGKFMPIWMNDDLNDLFCNTDNAVAIAASGGGGWTNIAKINGVIATDLAKVDGISVDDIAKICGVAV